jgi:hypothetical protein
VQECRVPGCRGASRTFAPLHLAPLALPFFGLALDAIFLNLPAERVAVKAHFQGRLREVALRLREGARDEAPLQFLTGFVEQDALLQHLVDELFETIAHREIAIPAPGP